MRNILEHSKQPYKILYAAEQGSKECHPIDMEYGILFPVQSIFRGFKFLPTPF